MNWIYNFKNHYLDITPYSIELFDDKDDSKVGLYIGRDFSRIMFGYDYMKTTKNERRILISFANIDFHVWF